MSFIRQVRNKADQVALEGDKLLRIQRKQGEIGQTRKLVDQKLSQLGAVTYGLHGRGQALPSEIEQICREIDALYSDIRVRQDEIEMIRAETLVDGPGPSVLRCTACGRALPEGAAFCQHCGTAVPPPRPRITCGNCGASLPADARFCAECGREVASQPPSPAPGSDVETNPPEAEELKEATVPYRGGEEGNEADQATAMRTAEVPGGVVCRVCGEELADDAMFCPNCGGPVAGAAAGGS